MVFSFRLQTLLNYKRNLEELSQVRLAQCRNDLSLQEDRLQRLSEDREAYEREFQQKTSTAAPVNELALYLEFRDQSHARRLMLEEGREKILSEIERERGRLMALTQDRKILEKLKERQQRAFMFDLAQKERKNLEDLVVQRYRAGRSEN